jgi:hypothetical protein
MNCLLRNRFAQVAGSPRASECLRARARARKRHIHESHTRILGDFFILFYGEGSQQRETAASGIFEES